MQKNKSHNAINVIDRLKTLLKITTDIELSEFLNIKPNTISTWKKRDSLDYDSIIAICELYELDLNKVFLGKKGIANYEKETPLVCRETQFQYASGIDGPILLDILPKYHFPFIGENSRAFQVVGNNMFPIIEENSFVICEKVEIEDIVDNTILVVVSKTKGLFINRVARSQYNNNNFILTNENDFYNDINLKSSEISESWSVSGILSYDLNKESKLGFINDSIKKLNHLIATEKTK